MIPRCLLPKDKFKDLISPEKVQKEKKWEKNRKMMSEALVELRDTSVNNSYSQTKRKVKNIGPLIQKCQIDMRVSGDRLVVSFFDDQSRDQVAKFASPPISLAMLIHPRQNPEEASYEIFGFQMQQSTDLNLVGNFFSALLTQVQMFTKHESIRKGQVFYNEIFTEYKQKEDEKRYIT